MLQIYGDPLPPSRPKSPTESNEGLTENPGTQLCFSSQCMENVEFFSFLANALVSHLQCLNPNVDSNF